MPTPIGNLGDITLRAIEVLKLVDIIACEDMRVTQKLLNHFDIKTKCVSYHKFNEKERINSFIEILKSGKKMALVSDAGTPLFCDPGSVLVDELRKNGFLITSLPGANAVVTFLSQVPRENENFNFVGFLPKTKSQIVDIFKRTKFSDLVFYDSPNRIMNTLEIIEEIYPKAKVAVGRELTKVFEEVKIGNVHDVISHFKEKVIKGEIVAMIYQQGNNTCELDDIDEKIEILKSKNYKAKEISQIISLLYGINKNEVYKRVLER